MREIDKLLGMATGANSPETAATQMIGTEASATEVITVNFAGHLQIYRIDNRTTWLVWQTPPIFGKVLTVGDLSGNGVPEIVGTVGNLPETLQSSDQFIILEQTEDLYMEGWRSPRFEARIVDMKIDDADNDDRNELIVCLQIRKGTQIQLYAALR